MAKPRKRSKNKQNPTAMLSCLSRIKLIIASSKVSIAPLRAVYTDFCEETTLHGLRHTVEPKLHFLERVLWLVLTVSAFVGAVYCALSQLSRYTQEPVVVSVQRDYRSWQTTFPAVTACFLERLDPDKARQAIEFCGSVLSRYTQEPVVVSVQRDYRSWQTTFPAVTACFLERLDPDKARQAIELHWNVTEESDPERFQYYTEFLELVSDVSFRENLQNFWKYQEDETVKGIDLLQLALSVHPSYHLNVMLSHEKKEVRWYPTMTEVGMCLTFNSQYAQYQHMEQRPWRQDRLLRCHYHSGQCYVRVDSIDNAIRYFIHSPYEISTAISNPTGEVAPGEELIIDFKAVEIQASPSLKGLTLEQRRCRYPDEWISPSVKAYSFALCQMHCRSRMALMFCGCRPFFHVKGDGDVCDAHGMACIGRNVEILINIPKNLAKCSCLPQCAEINFYSHTKKVVVSFFPSNMNLTSSEAPSVAALRINMMPPKLRLHRDVIFTLEDLFASLGGTTALFVGASVLTVVETALFIIRRLVSAVLTNINQRSNMIQFNSK